MIRLFDALGLEDALTSVVEAVNTDERLRRRQWWSADDLDNMPTRVRDRLRLDAAPSPSVTPTPETTSPS